MSNRQAPTLPHLIITDWHIIIYNVANLLQDGVPLILQLLQLLVVLGHGLIHKLLHLRGRNDTFTTHSGEHVREMGNTDTEGVTITFRSAMPLHANKCH